MTSNMARSLHGVTRFGPGPSPGSRVWSRRFRIERRSVYAGDNLLSVGDIKPGSVNPGNTIPCSVIIQGDLKCIVEWIRIPPVELTLIYRSIVCRSYGSRSWTRSVSNSPVQASGYERSFNGSARYDAYRSQRPRANF